MDLPIWQIVSNTIVDFSSINNSKANEQTNKQKNICRHNWLGKIKDSSHTVAY